MPDFVQFEAILKELEPFKARLIAVSKTKPVSDIRQFMNRGQLDFGENYVQELVEKQPQLPEHIRWHFIGHLQTNKVKQIAGFVHLIHGIDSLKALAEVDKQAKASNRVIDVLLQIHIAKEESKYGISPTESVSFYQQFRDLNLSNVVVRGLMGMATFTDDESLIRSEFKQMRKIFDEMVTEFREVSFDTLSMGMSSDYKIALEEGSTMVRIGSSIFGER